MRTLLSIVLIAAFVHAPARPKFLTLFGDHYKVQAENPNGDAACRNCHTTPPQHNSYGVDLKAALRANRASNLSIALLESIESRDSDQDGWLNGDEIRQGFLPGDPESHPDSPPSEATEPPNSSGSLQALAQPESTVVEPTSPPWIPPHSFHPAVVHFPIALFLFGALLEVLGFVRREPALRRAGFLNLAAGSLATAIVVPTGLAALLRVGFPFASVRVHVTLALAATLSMVGVALWRRRGEHTHSAYWVILAAAALLVALTGHFGSKIVFG